MNNTKQNTSSHKMRLRLLGVILIAFFVAGCSSPGRGGKSARKNAGGQTQKIDELKVRQFAGSGYDSGTEYATESSKLSLNLDSTSHQISVVQPKRNGKYPLVIYLPGLGESNDAGKDMRNAWAKSGYVAIAMQPLQDDETIMSTAAAQEGDFSYIRHERYATAVISSRFAVLTKLIEYLKKQAVLAESGFNKIDMRHVAIAGFDIGANLAMIVAGEDGQNISNAGLPIKVAGIIALSPYADFSGLAFDSRYQNINLPVLSVTSDADDDTHGSVPIALHQAPFQYMPVGNKYLFLLAGASHALIGNGGQANEEIATGGANSQTKADDEAADKESGKKRGARNKRKEPRNSATSGAELNRKPVGATQRAMMSVAIEQISTAFLNAYVKNDSLAQEWLNKDAPSWLNNMGQLKEK